MNRLPSDGTQRVHDIANMDCWDFLFHSIAMAGEPDSVCSDTSGMDWKDLLFHGIAMAHEPEFLDPLGVAALRLVCRDGREAAESIVCGRGGLRPELLKTVWAPKVSDAMRLWTVGEMEAAGVPFDRQTAKIAMETISDHCKLGAFLRRFAETDNVASRAPLSARGLPPGADIRNLRAATDAGIPLAPELLALIVKWEYPTPQEAEILFTREQRHWFKPGDHIWNAFSHAMDAGNVDLARKLSRVGNYKTSEFLEPYSVDSRLAGRVFAIDPARSYHLDDLVACAANHGPEELRRVIALVGDTPWVRDTVFAGVAREGNMECMEIMEDRAIVIYDFDDAIVNACASRSDEVALFALSKLYEINAEYREVRHIMRALVRALEKGNFRTALSLTRLFPDAIVANTIPCAKLIESSGDDTAAHLRDLLDHLFTNLGATSLDQDSVRTMVRSKAPEEHVLACMEILMEFGARHRAEDIIAALTHGFPAVARMLAARAEAAHQNRASDAVALLCVEHCMHLAPRDIALLLRWANH